MTQKEKAQAYDETIERANSLLSNNQLGNAWIYKLLPELNIDEDEKIRKEIIQFLYLPHPQFVGKRNYEEWIAWIEKHGKPNPYSGVSFDYNGHTWGMCARDNGVDILLDRQLIKHLEKQGKQEEPQVYKTKDGEIITYSETDGYKVEQTPTDNVKSKFKVEKDKWYICISQFCNCIEGRVYKATSDSRIIDDFGTEYDIHSDAYKYFRLWSIDDAKDGDVLVHSSFMFDDFVFIYNSTSILQAYCYYSNEKKRFIIEDKEHYCPWNMQEVKPATKEQRDLLFSKMHKAGYEWDAKKKKLKKISQRMVSAEAKEAMYSKPTWSEEVIATISRAISIVKWAAYSDHSHPILNDKGATELVERLNFLKDRCTWKPSDEQMDALHDAAVYVDKSMFPYPKGILMKLYEQLKKLKGEL